MTEKTTALTPFDEFRAQVSHRDMQTQILNYFGGDEDIARKFTSAVVHSVRKTPKLLECSRASLFEAFTACAEYKLFPSAVSGEAFVLPYNSKNGMHAQFQLGYQGLITLFYRAGVQSLRANIVYENDTFHYQEGLHALLDHIPTPFGKPKGKAIGVYAVAVINGEQIFKVMGADEVEEYKKFSKSAKSDFSPWNSNDPEKWMWKKTCIKQLGKLLPKNDTLQNAIGRDNEESTVSDISERRSIDASKLREDAPTMGKLKAKKEDNEKGKNTETPKGEGLFGVAGNHSE